MRQIIPCTENLYAVYSDSNIGECKLKVLFFGIDNHGDIEPLVFDADFGVSRAYRNSLLRFELDCADWLREDNVNLRKCIELLKKKCELLKQKEGGAET